MFLSLVSHLCHRVQVWGPGGNIILSSQFVYVTPNLVTLPPVSPPMQINDDLQVIPVIYDKGKLLLAIYA